MKMPDLRPYKDETLNDSDKSWVVPDGEVWKLKRVWVDFAATATVGNRVPAVEIKDKAGAVIARLPSQYAAAASATTRILFAPNVNNQNANTNLGFTVEMPEFLVMPGCTLRIYDVWAIDAAADDMKVYFQVEVGTV